MNTSARTEKFFAVLLSLVVRVPDTIECFAHTHYCTSRRLATAITFPPGGNHKFSRISPQINEKPSQNVHLARVDQNVHGKSSQELVFGRFVGDSIKNACVHNKSFISTDFFFSLLTSPRPLVTQPYRGVARSISRAASYSPR